MKAYLVGDNVCRRKINFEKSFMLLKTEHDY